MWPRTVYPVIISVPTGLRKNEKFEQCHYVTTKELLHSSHMHNGSLLRISYAWLKDSGVNNGMGPPVNAVTPKCYIKGPKYCVPSAAWNAVWKQPQQIFVFCRSRGLSGSPFQYRASIHWALVVSPQGYPHLSLLWKQGRCTFQSLIRIFRAVFALEIHNRQHTILRVGLDGPGYQNTMPFIYTRPTFMCKVL